MGYVCLQSDLTSERVLWICDCAAHPCYYIDRGDRLESTLRIPGIVL